MLGTTNPQPSLWEAILPEGCLGLPPELARVDALLDAPAFRAPLARHVDSRIGRPCVPLDTYLRMMFLKCRYRLGDELLCDRRWATGPGGRHAGRHHRAHPGHRRRGPYQGPGPPPCRPAPRAPVGPVAARPHRPG
jgi:hypothetical protein